MNRLHSRPRRLVGLLTFRLLTLALACVCAGGAARAQAQGQTNSTTGDEDAPDFIVPARPTASNPAEFQRPGVLQLEYGFNGNWRAPGGASALDTPLALRFAVSRRLLLEFDGDTPASQAAEGQRTTGAGDSQLGLQLVLQHEAAARPGVAFAYYVKLPTASEGLGTGRVDHSLLALVSKKSGKTDFDFNAVYLLAGRTTDEGHASSAQAALAASRNVTERVGVQGELSGSTRNDAQPGAAFGLGVVTYQVNRRLVFDCGLRLGLTHDAPRVGAVAGLTVGVADLYHKHGAGR
ncbi:MAG: transporter [Acidobacteria bacterium]|nr:transporter [Acidobacteriota bacterium]